MNDFKELPFYDGYGKLFKTMKIGVQYRAIRKETYILLLQKGESEQVKPYAMSYEKRKTSSNEKV